MAQAEGHGSDALGELAVVGVDLIVHGERGPVTVLNRRFFKQGCNIHTDFHTPIGVYPITLIIRSPMTHRAPDMT